MQGLFSVWRAMSPAKRITLIGAVALTALLLGLIARTASAPNLSLLYADLDARAAGEVISALEKMDIPATVRGDAIYVPTHKRDSARMSLAGQGLPAQGQAGYELLDKLNGFSTTSDMFDATYWRAKEGELARTILATPGVRAARVHIAHQKAGAFSRVTAPATAVVTITTGAARVQESQAHAIRFLVASAVPNLAADQVAVIDSERGVVLSPGKTEEFVIDQNGVSARERRLEKSILDLVEARVGAGNARVQVALEIDMEREAISERVLNPEGRIIAGKETIEVTETSSGSGRGAVTVASNLPDGDAANKGGEQRSERTETRESVNYDVSEIKRERQKLPGAVKRMSVAVFVNQTIDAAPASGEEPALRTEEELEALKSLVASAAGLNEARGDSLTVQALPFKAAGEAGVLATPNMVADLADKYLMNSIQIAVLGVVTLVLGLFVVKPLLTPKDLTPEQIALMNPASAAAAAGRMESADEPADATPPDLIANLKQITSSNSDQTVKILRDWLDTAEDAA